MPPKGKLPEEEMAVLVEWVRRSATVAEEQSSALRIRLLVPATFNFDEPAQHWCFQPSSPPRPCRRKFRLATSGRRPLSFVTALKARG